MPNITVRVDQDTYRNARILAARLDTSVSALVTRFLQSGMELDASEDDFEPEIDDRPEPDFDRAEAVSSDIANMFAAILRPSK
jgi:hypothetical protein